MGAHLLRKARATAASCHQETLRGSSKTEYSGGRSGFMGHSKLEDTSNRTKRWCRCHQRLCVDQKSRNRTGNAQLWRPENTSLSLATTSRALTAISRLRLDIFDAQGATIATTGVAGWWLLHWACGRLVKNMARRSSGQEMVTGHGVRAKGACEEKKTNNTQERQTISWHFSMCYRTKGAGARGRAHGIGTRATLFIIQNLVVALGIGWIWRLDLGI